MRVNEQHSLFSHSQIPPAHGLLPTTMPTSRMTNARPAPLSLRSTSPPSALPPSTTPTSPGTWATRSFRRAPSPGPMTGKQVGILPRRFTKSFTPLCSQVSCGQFRWSRNIRRAPGNGLLQTRRVPAALGKQGRPGIGTYARGREVKIPWPWLSICP